MFLLEALAAYAETDRVALVYGAQQLTFRELNRQSDAFAAWLLERFGEDRTPVLLYGHKELTLPVCMFGALKAGRGYVPVDTTFPVERVRQIAEELQPRVVVDLYNAGVTAEAVLQAEELNGILSGGGTVSRETWIRPEQTAYMLFTSGSTGKPKGVEISRRSRGTPRIANRLLKRLRDFAEVKGTGVITKEIARIGLEAMGVDEHGLDEIDRKVLLAIITKYNGGPVGPENIAASISESVNTIEDVCEPYLMQIGLLQRTPRGRIATPAAYQYFGIPQPVTAAEKPKKNTDTKKEQGSLF